MGLRETLQEHKGLTTAVAGVVIVGALGMTFFQVFGGSATADSLAGGAYYTIDEGKTYFSERATNVPPFTHDGQTAVKAHVYECDGQKFVAYLEQYTPDAREVIVASQTPISADAVTSGPPAFAAKLPKAMTEGKLLKRPGDKDWVQSTKSQAQEIMRVKCPGNVAGTPQLVSP